MSVDAWPVADGVVEFLNGVRVRGRGLGRGAPSGPDPTIGVYLLARNPPQVPWPSEWIKWPDFRLPSDRDRAIRNPVDVFGSADSGRLEVACQGGRGRTGTALAILAVASGIAPREAVEWVRAHYHPQAIETPWQRRWIENLKL